MSNIDPTIKNTDVIPFVESDVFDFEPDSRFAVGMLAVGNNIIPGLGDAFKGYLQLRWNVYGPQTNMLDAENMRDDGTEMDRDDARSIHFAILENHPEGNRVVACIRRILKSEVDPSPLPIEEFFPEVFNDEPAPMGATEASRYIARHEKAGVQRTFSGQLFAAYTSHVLAHGMGPTYGVVEPAVESDLRAKGVPLERVADPVYVPEYNDYNLGIMVNVPLLGASMELSKPGVLEEMRQTEGSFVYYGRAAVAGSLVPQHEVA